MRDYEPSTYGDRIADVYDELYGALQDVQPMVTLLAELANKGRALELGIGTGRLAIPLAGRGVKVEAIDASERMVAKMREKPVGEHIQVTIGDFADVGVNGKFSLIFVTFNTFFALLTQDDQVRCFRNVATHLERAGVFLVEAFVPDVTRFVRGQNLQTNTITPDHVMLDASRHDSALQRVSSQHVHITEDGVRLYPVELRYVWPSEMDLMAQLAGLRLRNRWSGWKKEPFNSGSTSHVSVYEWA
jgi:SAM-dependent methyltransferase